MRRSFLLLALPLLLTACDSGRGDVPRRAVITAVQIDDAPLRAANGNEWDGAGGGGPDVYFRLLLAGDAPTSAGVLNPRDDAFVVNTFRPEQGWYDDVRGSSFPLVWSVEGGFEVRSLTEEYEIVLVDYDPTTEDDVMISTRPFRFAEQAPEVTDGREDTIILDGVGADAGRVRVRLRVVYES